MTGFGLCYVGDSTRGLDMAGFLERHTESAVHVVTASPDSVGSVLADDRIDAVVCGGTVDEASLERIVDAVDAADATLPVFDLTDGTVAVPESVEHYQLYPGVDPVEAADRVVSVVGEEGSAVDATAPGGEWTRPVFQGLDAYLAVDPEGRVTAWDPDLAEWTGVTLVDAVGRPLEEVFESADDPAFRDAREAVRETGQARTTEFRTAMGDWLRVRVAPDGRGGLRCFVRDISDRKAYQAEVQATRERFENTIERVTDAFFVLDSDERFVILNSRTESLLGVDADDVVGERFWDVCPAAISTSFYRGFTEAMDTQQPTSFEEHYQPQESWFEVNAYPSEDGLSVFLRDITERVDLRQKLESLHERTQRLIVSDSEADIAEDAVAAAVDVLGFPLTVCWTYEETSRRLEVLAHSETVAERVGTVQPIERGEGPAWTAYDEGQRRVVDAVDPTAGSHHPGGVASSLLVPLGEYGLLGSYADEEAAFDETDVELFRLLGAAVESAMARAERERQLARRNERLDEFASTVSHDLRNPLHVAVARTDLARESGDLDHLETVSDALDRMETLIEDLLARARGEQDIERRPVSLATVAGDAWEGVATGSATLSVVDDATIEADPTRLTQLFENLFRNAVEHGGEAVTVSIGTHGDGFYVADDGSGIPEAVADDLFEQGVSGSDGTGYGLAIVADVVRSHDWTVEAAESAEGGARFEVSHVHSLSEQWAA